MKLLLILPTFALLYTGLVAAQDCVDVALTAIPSCAQNCIVNGAPSIGCGGTDFDCQCSQSAALFAAVEGCVSTACPVASYQAVIDGASTVCDCASPAVLAATAAGTASVSGIGSVSAPATNSATATSSAASATGASTSSGGGTVTAGGGTTTSASGQGNGNTWTGYTSVSNVATASALGAAAQATPPSANVVRLIVPVVVVGAAML